MNRFQFDVRRLILLTARLARRGFLLGLVSFVVLTAAFQAPYVYRVDLGASHDSQYVIGFYTPEVEAGRTFRWTKERSALELPALTQGDWRIHMTIDAAQPEGTPPVRLILQNADVFGLNTKAGWREYRTTRLFLAGDALLTFETTTFHPQEYGGEDTRVLGIKVDEVSLEPIGTGFRFPPIGDYVLPFAIMIVLIDLLVQRLGFDIKLALLGDALVLASVMVLI